MTYKYEVANTDDLAPGDEVALFNTDWGRKDMEEGLSDAFLLSLLTFTTWRGPGHEYPGAEGAPLAPLCYRRVREEN